MRKLHNLLLVSSCIAPVMFSTVAMAQEADTNDSEAKDEEIVVVGTLIRGKEVTGAQTLSVSAQDIAAKAASNTNELLGAIPQIANAFNGRFEGDPRGYGGSGTSITRPNLRNLPSSNTTSGALTLMLADNMRLTPVGVNQASPDADIIPAAVIAGIDVVTDGGSSLYGADAVAGVLNFRTLRKFDGVKLDGNFGFGSTIKGYQVWDASATVGHSWNGGNAYVSVTRMERDNIQNFEVPWVDPNVYSAAGVASLPFSQCANAVGSQIRYVYLNIPGLFTGWTNNPAAGGATIPIGSTCDSISADVYVPKQTRTNVFASISQEFGDNIDFRMTGYWFDRDTELVGFPRGYTTPAQPAPVGAPGSPGAPASSPVTLLGGTSFSFGPHSAYVNTPQQIGIETWGVSPEVTVKVGGDWQVRANAHFGRSYNFQSFPGVDNAKAQCYIAGCTAATSPTGAAIAAGQLNPLNAAAASAAVITDILNFENAQRTNQQMLLFRVVADGSLMELPGGSAKVAIGAEYQENKAESQLATGVVGLVDSSPWRRAKRNSKSVFGEISLPVTEWAELSGSVRYDDYSDFGSTTNPNIGLTLRPTDWLKIYGHWNTSFNAPTAIDTLEIGTGRFACGIYTDYSANPALANPSRRPNDPLGRDTSKQGTCALVLQGSGANLQPQTAESWAVGFEATPGSGVRFGGQFYSLDLDNALGTLNPANTATYSTNPDKYTYNLTQAQYLALVGPTGVLANGAALLGQQPLASNLAIVVDTRISNLNAARIEGIDFHFSWEKDFGSGKFGMGTAGTYMTKALITNGGVTTNQLGVGSAKFVASSYATYSTGGFNSRITVNYTGHIKDAGFNNFNLVETTDPFILTNLALSYSFDGSGGPLGGLTLRANVDNVFGVEPYRIKRANTNNPSYVNWTLGRMFKLGASYKF